LTALYGHKSKGLFARQERGVGIQKKLFHLSDAKRNKAFVIREVNNNMAQILLCWHWSNETVKAQQSVKRRKRDV